LTQHPDDKPVPGGGARPFRVALPESVLADLRERLDRTRWPDEIPGSGWSYGMSLPYAKELAAYWRDGYDWRAQEARLNAFEQYTVSLGGIDLHFIHERGAGEDPLPILLLHGWPSSVWEFHKIVRSWTSSCPTATGRGSSPSCGGANPAVRVLILTASIEPGLRGRMAEAGFEPAPDDGAELWVRREQGLLRLYTRPEALREARKGPA